MERMDGIERGFLITAIGCGVVVIAALVALAFI
jgi:hypothetical protein